MKSKKKNKGKALRVSELSRVNGIYHDVLNHMTKATIEEDKKKRIPRKQKYKNRMDKE